MPWIGITSSVPSLHHPECGNVERRRKEPERQPPGERFKNRRTPLRVFVRRHQTVRLVVAPQLRRIGFADPRAVNAHLHVRRHFEGRRRQHLAVHCDDALLDQLFSIAARGDAGAREIFCDPFAG